MFADVVFRFFSGAAEICLKQGFISDREAQTVATALGSQKLGKTSPSRWLDSFADFRKLAPDFVQWLEFRFGASSLQGMLLAMDLSILLQEWSQELLRFAQSFRDRSVLFHAKLFTLEGEVISPGALFFELGERAANDAKRLKDIRESVEKIPVTLASLLSQETQTLEGELQQALFNSERILHISALGHFHAVAFRASEVFSLAKDFSFALHVALQTRQDDTALIDLSFRIEKLTHLCEHRPLQQRPLSEADAAANFYAKARENLLSKLSNIKDSLLTLLQEIEIQLPRSLQVEVKPSFILRHLTADVLQRHGVSLREAYIAAKDLAKYCDDHNVEFSKIVLGELTAIHPRFDETLQKSMTEAFARFQNNEGLKGSLLRESLKAHAQDFS